MNTYTLILIGILLLSLIAIIWAIKFGNRNSNYLGQKDAYNGNPSTWNLDDSSNHSHHSHHTECNAGSDACSADVSSDHGGCDGGGFDGGGHD